MKKHTDFYLDVRKAWSTCNDGELMLGFAAQVNVDMRLLCKAKGLCAKPIIRLMRDKENKNAVKAAIEYGNGLIDSDELQKYSKESQLHQYSHDSHDCNDVDIHAALAAKYTSRNFTDPELIGGEHSAAASNVAYALGYEAFSKANKTNPNATSKNYDAMLPVRVKSLRESASECRATLTLAVLNSVYVRQEKGDLHERLHPSQQI